MAAANRATRLTKLVADLKKRYKPAPVAPRPLFETLVFATLLENSLPDAAAKAFGELEASYFDWNEVRVSTRAELAERAKSLNDPLETADRLKRTLQSVFETIYGFDLEAMKKQNLGQAVKQLSGFDGVTPFVVNYVTQHALAGHAIAVNGGVMMSLLAMDIVTEAEAKKGVVPGLERAVPKNKGVEAQAVLHELGVEVAKNPYGPAARKLLTDIDPSCKDRLPKRPKVEEPAPVVTPPKSALPAMKDVGSKKPVPGKDAAPAAKKPAEAAKEVAGAKKPLPAKPDAKPPAAKSPQAPAAKPAAPAAKAPAAAAAKTTAPLAKKPDAKKPEPGKKPEAKKPELKKPETKKPELKKPAAAAPVKKAAPAPAKKPEPAKKPAAPAVKKDAKKAPPSAAPKKGAAKKPADKKPAKRKPK